jgi:hypothetical protein
VASAAASLQENWQSWMRSYENERSQAAKPDQTSFVANKYHF